MPTPKILLVHEDASLPFHVEQGLGIKGSVVSIPTKGRTNRKIGKQHFPLIVVEGGENGHKNLQRLYRLNGKTKHSTILLAPSSLIQNHSEVLTGLSSVVLRKSNGAGPSRSSSKPADDLCLKDFIERKLRNFVGHMKASGGQNLYSMLLAEVERPLISYVLKETRGKQVQAARLLGMNRNTLRKKMKELKIATKQTSKTRPRK